MGKKLIFWSIMIVFLIAIPILIYLAPLKPLYHDLNGIDNQYVPISAQFKNSTISTSAEPNEIVLSSNYAFVAENNIGINIYKINSINSINKIKNFAESYNVTSMTIDGRTLIVGTNGNGIHLYNITNSENPIELGSVNTTNIHLDIEISGDYVYSVSKTNGLIVTNINELNSPVEVSHLSINSASAIKLYGDYAFVATQLNGVDIVDISNPFSPNIINHISTYEDETLKIEGFNLYLIHASGLSVYNIQDPYHPELISNIPLENSLKYKDLGFFGSFLYASNSESTIIFDIANNHNPIKQNYTLPGGNKIEFDDNNAYILQTNGIKVLEMGYFYNYNDTNKEYFPSYYYKTNGIPYDLEIQGDIAFICTSGAGLRIWNITELSQINSSWSYYEDNTNTNLTANTFTTVGEHHVLQKLNITMTENWKGAYDLYDIEFDGNLGYITSRQYGLICLNFSNIYNPITVGSFLLNNSNTELGNSYNVLKISGDTAIIGTAAENGALEIITVNITDPRNITLLDQYTLPTDFEYEQGMTTDRVVDIELDGNLLYVISKFKGLDFQTIYYTETSPRTTFTVLDITNPSDIIKKSNLTMNITATCLEFYSHYVYLASDSYDLESGSSGIVIKIIDIQDIENLQIINEFSRYSLIDQLNPSDLIINGKNLYVATVTSILILDASDPENLTLIQSYPAFYPNDLRVSGENLYFTQTTSFDSYYALMRAFCIQKIKNGGSIDIDNDGLTYLEEQTLGSNSTLIDTDGDGINDNIEFKYGLDITTRDNEEDADGDGIGNLEEISLGLNPKLKDTDGDKYSDQIELIEGSNPLDKANYPDLTYLYIYLGVALACFFGFVVSSYYLKKAYRKDFELGVYLCHAPEDSERYKVPEINKNIAKNKQIVPIDKLDENVQVFIYLASNITLNCEEYRQKLELARQMNLFIIPVKSESIDWPDMATLNLHRELGVEYKTENLDAVKSDIVKFLKNYQIDFTKLRNVIEKFQFTLVDLLSFKTNVSKDQIIKIVPHLISTGVVLGAFSADKKSYLSIKEIQKRINDLSGFGKKHTLSDLINNIGIESESIPKVISIIENLENKKKKKMINQRRN